jgi:hypothetical protein
VITPHWRHAELVSASIVWRDRPYRLQPQPHRQIRPRQILGFDQIDFPRAMPVLQLLLALDCRRHVLKKLEADEAIDSISRRKPPTLRLAMLPHPRPQVRRHADIQRPVMLARKNINARLFAHSNGFTKNHRHPELVSGSIPCPATIGCVSQWMLKQVQHDGFWQVVK